MAAQHDIVIAALKGNVKNKAFIESFSPFDILWVVLAIGSAFKIGSGAASNR